MVRRSNWRSVGGSLTRSSGIRRGDRGGMAGALVFGTRLRWWHQEPPSWWRCRRRSVGQVSRRPRSWRPNGETDRCCSQWCLPAATAEDAVTEPMQRVEAHSCPQDRRRLRVTLRRSAGRDPGGHRRRCEYRTPYFHGGVLFSPLPSPANLMDTAGKTNAEYWYRSIQAGEMLNAVRNAFDGGYRVFVESGPYPVPSPSIEETLVDCDRGAGEPIKSFRRWVAMTAWGGLVCRRRGRPTLRAWCAASTWDRRVADVR